jgi:hypothetical protein
MEELSSNRTDFREILCWRLSLKNPQRTGVVKLAQNLQALHISWRQCLRATHRLRSKKHLTMLPQDSDMANPKYVTKKRKGLTGTVIEQTRQECHALADISFLVYTKRSCVSLYLSQFVEE